MNCIRFDNFFIFIISTLIEARKEVPPVEFDIENPDTLFNHFNKEFSELKELMST